MGNRKSLTDILRNGEADDLAAAWTSTEAAGDFAPLPAGEYSCRVLAGELFNSRTGTPGYKVTFEVAEGQYAGRRLWFDAWLTEAALPMAKRDLGKLGIDTLDKLSHPLPQGILARVKVALRSDDGGAAYNRVRSFDVTGTEAPDPFAPAASADPPEEAGDQADDEDTSFDFGANAAPPATTAMRNGTAGGNGHPPTAAPPADAKAPGGKRRAKPLAGPSGDGPYGGERR